jgi:hypothetical protein
MIQANHAADLGNLEPIDMEELAQEAGMDLAEIEGFFDGIFGSYENYVEMFRNDQEKLGRLMGGLMEALIGGQN